MLWVLKRSDSLSHLFDLILYIQINIFQLCQDGSSWVEPVLSAGAKSQILSSVAPLRKNKLVTFLVSNMSGGLRDPCLLSFLWSIFCKWPVMTVTPQTLKIAVHKIQD